MLSYDLLARHASCHKPHNRVTGISLHLQIRTIALGNSGGSVLSSAPGQIHSLNQLLAPTTRWSIDQKTAVHLKCETVVC